MFDFLKPAKPDIDILNETVMEIYSMLSIASSSQRVIITIDDPMKTEKMIIRINGRMWQHTNNPIAELREMHNILALNVKHKRSITVTLE